MGKHHDHEGDPHAVDAERQKSRFCPLSHAFVGNQVQDCALPIPDSASRSLIEGRGRPCQVCGRPSDQVPSGRVGLPRGLSALGGRVCLLPDQSLQPRLHGNFEVAGSGRFTFDHSNETITEPADLLFKRAEEFTGSDELVPACQHLPAEQRSVSGLHLDGADSLGVGVVHLCPQLVGYLDLFIDRLG